MALILVRPKKSITFTDNSSTHIISEHTVITQHIKCKKNADAIAAAFFQPCFLSNFPCLLHRCILVLHGFSTVAGGPLLLGDEDIPGLGALEGAYNALFLHLVHDSGSSGIAQL